MSTKTLLNFTLTLGLMACADDVANGDASGSAVFAQANENRVASAATIATGGDVQMAAMMAAFLDLSDAPCFSVMSVDDGLRYSGTGSSDCEGDFTGTVTIYGVTEAGWSLASPEEVEIVFDGVDFGGLDEDTGEYMPWLIDGEVAITSSPDGATSIEADLFQDFYGMAVESHVRMSGDEASLTHQPGSRGFVSGLGSFTIRGETTMVETVDGFRTGGVFELTGVDTMRIEMPASDGACIKYEVAENADELCMD